jgi:O-antigen ligase
LIAIGILNYSEAFSDGWRFMGTTDNPNVLAIMMIVSIYISIRYLMEKKLRIYHYYQYFNIFMALYIIFLSGSKKGVLFSIVLLGITLLFQMRNIQTFFLLLMKLLGFFIIIYYVGDKYLDLEQLQSTLTLLLNRFNAFLEGTDNSTVERLFFIQEGLRQFSEHPLFGLGISNFIVLYGLYTHNNYIELLANVGIIGFVLFYLIYFFLFVKIFNMKNGFDKLMLFVFIILTLFMQMAFISYYSKLMFLLIIAFAVIAESNKKSEKLYV